MVVNVYLIDIIINILKKQSVFVSRKEVYRVLFSDSHFPSLASITTTLSYFGINSNAYFAHIDDLKGMSNALLHTNEKEGHFYIMNSINDDVIDLYDGKRKSLSISQFISLWDGIVLTVEDKHNFGYIEKNNNNKYALPIVLSIIFILSIMVISDELLYNFIANILGLTCSFILFHQQINIYEHTLFCEIGKNIDCNYVSKKNPVSKWIPAGLPIIGIYYFLFDLAYLFAIQTQNFLTLSVNLSAALIMMALAVYQITKIKKYCLFCLGITFIVILKLAFFIFPLPPITFRIFTETLLLAAVIYIICYLLFFKTINSKILLEREIELLSIKRNESVLSCYFDKVSNLNIQQNLSLCFGNINALDTITTVISLDCEHCKKVVKDVNLLMQKFPQKYRWQLVIDGFEAADNNKDAFIKNNKRQLYLYTLYRHSQTDCLKTLFAQSYKEHFNIFDETIITYRDLLASIRNMNIQHYPSVFINSHRLPSGYKITDIPYISDILNKNKI